MKKLFILILLFIILLPVIKNENILKLDSMASETSILSESYIFVAKWGSKGSGEGEFGIPGYEYADWFKVTDEVIKGLEDKIDKEKLETINFMINQKLDEREFLEALEKLHFTGIEMQLLMKQAALEQLYDTYPNGPTCMAIDFSDNIYLGDTYNGRIQKFDSNGNFIIKWGSKGLDEEQFHGIHELTIDLEGNILVSSNRSIQKFDSNGNFIMKWLVYDFEICRLLGFEGGQISSPSGIAVDSEGNLLITDHSNYIQQLDSNGNFIKKWLELDKPYPSYRAGLQGDIAITKEGYVYIIFTSKEKIITDDPSKTISVNWGIAKFNLSGDFIKEWGQEYGYAFKSITVGPNGNLFAINTLTDTIQKYNSDGDLLTEWGSYGNGDGQFIDPEDIEVDSKGNVYVLDSVKRCIQKFTPNPDYNLDNN